MSWIARWSDGELELDESRSYVVGRSVNADITIDGAGVSRTHGQLSFEDGQWLYRDTSSGGTFADAVKITQVPIDELLELNLGGFEGPLLTFAERPVALPAPPPSPVVDANDGGTIAFTDAALRLELGDQTLVAEPGQRVLVGRGEDCDLRTDDRLVSAQHCAFTYDGSTWTIEDLGSTRGTYIDGKMIAGTTKVEGAFHVGLGDDTAGATLRVVTAGEHVVPTDRRPLLLGAAALVVALLAGVGVFAFGGDGGDSNGPNSDAELAGARDATVFLVAEASTGSGAFISENLILTNRHVSEGAGDLWIGVSTGSDDPVELRYVGEHVASHPFLDVSVVRVRAALSEDYSTELPLSSPAAPAALPLGGSDDLSIGSEISAIGFPAITTSFGTLTDGSVLLPSVTISSGEIVTFQIWPGCENPDAELFLVEGGASSGCAPGADIVNGNIVSDDLTSSGGSGGPVVVGGEIVAIRYAALSAADTAELGIVSTGGVASSIPVDLAKDWIEEQLVLFEG